MAAPSAPTGLAASSNGRAVTLTWTAMGAGSPALTKIQYAKKVGAASYGSWTDLVTSSPATATTATLTGVEAGYVQFKIRGVNSDGNGAESSAVGVYIVATSTSRGTTLGLVSGAPASFNETGYDALTYTNCGELSALGEFGAEYGLITIQNLNEGTVRKLKGSRNNGSVDVELLFDSADSGQTALETALASNSPYSFKVDLPDGNDRFFRALVMRGKTMIGGPDDAIKYRTTLEIDHNSIVSGT